MDTQPTPPTPPVSPAPQAPSAGQQPQFPGAWSLFGPAIKALGLNFWTFVGLIAIPVVTMLVTLLIGGGIARSSTSAGGVIILLGVVVTFATALIISPALTLTMLRSARKQKIGVSEAWNAGKPFIGRNVLLGIYIGLLSIAGIILLVVPFFFVLKRYMLSPYYLIDRNLSVGEAMRQSAEASKQFSSALWGLVGVIAVITVVEFIPYAGRLASYILSVLYTCAPALRYYEIRQAQGDQVPHGTTHEDHSPAHTAPVSPIADQFK